MVKLGIEILKKFIYQTKGMENYCQSTVSALLTKGIKRR